MSSSEKFILVVDDERDVREELKEIFEAEGYTVSVASNGAEALDVVKREHPMVVLVDLNMPVMDGWQLLNALDNQRNPPVPALVLTAGRGDGKMPLNRPVFIKPVRVDELIRAVKAYDPDARRPSGG